MRARPSDRPSEAWTDGAPEAIAGDAVGVYSNFLGDEGDERIHEAYPGPLRPAGRHQAPLRPDNLFRLNQNIRPATRD